jgi:hypothetical protein
MLLGCGTVLRLPACMNALASRLGWAGCYAKCRALAYCRTRANPLVLPLLYAPARLQVLMSGLEGDLAAHLTRKLAQHGVASENILFCDY